MVFVYKPPLAVNLLEADGQPKVEFDALLFWVLIDAFHWAVGKGDVIAGNDMEIHDLEGMGPFFERI